MMRIQERIPREAFQEAFRPMVRSLGSKQVIIRLNEAAKTAIPRQTRLKELMPKLEILCYEQKRPKVDEELERLWTVYFEDRLGEKEGRFYELTEQLNKNLDGESLPKESEEVDRVKAVVGDITTFLTECEFTSEEVDLVFRVKAYPEVLKLFLDTKETE
jgi:hypothetical protein